MTASIAETSALLEALATAGRKWSQHEPAAREELLNLAHSLIATLEMPSEFVHRIGIAEVIFHVLFRLVKVQYSLFRWAPDGSENHSSLQCLDCQSARQHDRHGCPADR